MYLTSKRVGWTTGVRLLAEIFPLIRRVQTGLGTTQLPIQWLSGVFPPG
jgi:hypothetical protein